MNTSSIDYKRLYSTECISATVRLFYVFLKFTLVFMMNTYTLLPHIVREPKNLIWIKICVIAVHKYDLMRPKYTL